MPKIKFIIASTRPNRFGPKPAQWLMELARGRSDAEYGLIDLAEINLPFLDEPQLPSAHQYTHEHTKRWAAMIEEADGFIIIHPEYNHSIPGALKNAIDFLWQEWNYKPVAFVSYGASAGGARATENLREIAAELKMYDLRESIAMVNYWQYLDTNGNFTATEALTKSASSMLDQVVFWANDMKAARGRLSKQQ
jgi:NAD(P)H-dependent FMN reductase